MVSSLEHLANKGKLKVYGFVVMPNHIHLIWQNLELNGKEMPYISFMKFTAHQFLTELRKTNNPLLKRFAVDGTDRANQFWQKRGLSKLMTTRQILEQKLDYIHLNPLQAHWNLVDDPNNYYYSSCSYYEQEDKRFHWLTHYMEEFQ